MTKETFINFYENNYKKGSYVPIVRTTTKNGYTKMTRVVTRFVNYYNIESVKVSGKSENSEKKREYEEQIIPHILKKNLNTNNTLLMAYTTNHHKAHTSYFYGDIEITEEAYYNGINEKKKPHSNSPLFMFKIEEVELA